jgi:hypothetical protein
MEIGAAAFEHQAEQGIDGGHDELGAEGGRRKLGDKSDAGRLRRFGP